MSEEKQNINYQKKKEKKKNKREEENKKNMSIFTSKENDSFLPILK